MANLRIDVVSDAICPWCRVAKRLLERSLADVRGLEPHHAIVRWHPFPSPDPGK